MELTILHNSPQARASVLSRLRGRISENFNCLEQAIKEKTLYFRVSLVGTCNLSCPFCHNEGAPVKGKMDLPFAVRAIEAAAEVGFERVQFTGGEPLLHPQIARFVDNAKHLVPDVGITTNGTFLDKHIEDLIQAGLTRLHISLQVESLVEAGSDGDWGIPKWLTRVLDYAGDEKFSLRLNMPVPANMLSQAKDFLAEIARCGCDLKVFSILPEGDTRDIPYPLNQLVEIVDRENWRRRQASLKGQVFLRDYRPPQGERCGTCTDFVRCKEQSHSLRLGADHILRPCLATRTWDTTLKETNMKEQIEEATILALDF